MRDGEKEDEQNAILEQILAALEIRATPGVMTRSLGLEGSNQTPGGKRRLWQQ